MLYSSRCTGRLSECQTVKVGLVLGCRFAALRHAMKHWMVAGSVAGSPRCSMIATRVGGTSRIVTSLVVKIFCMSLLLALSRGPKAASHGSQSGDFRKDDDDCPNRCRKARAKASGAS